MEQFELEIFPQKISKSLTISSKEIKKLEKNEIEERTGVLENTYDINYCIKMLQVIQEQCYQHRLNPCHLYLTMDHSLKKMISHLKREKDKM